MKIVFLVFFLSLNKFDDDDGELTFVRTCKTSLLRSLELHSRLTANENLSLCPKIFLNCCTNYD